MIKHLQKEIEDLEFQLDTLLICRVQFTEHALSITQKEENFSNSLNRLVTKLDANFSHFMKNIKCKGKVELLNPSNFSSIGLDIKVSFRDDMELQSLNGQVQSGGVGICMVMLKRRKSPSRRYCSFYHCRKWFLFRSGSLMKLG